MVIKRLSAICGILFIGLQVLTAQKIWTLEECITRAVDMNIQMQNLNNAVAGSMIDIKQAKNSQFPSLSVSTNLGLNFGRTIDPTRNEFITQTFLSNGLSLNSGVVLFNGFRIRNTIQQAYLNSSAIKKDKEQLERDLALNVATAYLNIVFARENLKVVKLQFEQTQQQRQLLERLIAAGTRAPNDIYDLESQLAQNEQNVVVAQNNLESALLVLRQLIRLDPSMPLEIDAPPISIDDAAYTMIQFDELFSSAKLHQRDLQAAELRIRAAELSKKIAAAGHYPTIGTGFNIASNYSNRFQQIAGFEETIINQDILFQGQEVTIGFKQNIPYFEPAPYTRQIRDNMFYGVGISLNMPIYSNYAVRANKQRAAISVLNAKNNLESQMDNLRTSVLQAINEAKASRSRYDSALKNFTAQKNLYENTSKRFEAGSSNSFELARVKSLYEAADLNVLTARYDYFFRLKILDFYLGRPIRLN